MRRIASLLLALFMAFPALAQQSPTPSASAVIGITPVHSTAAEATRVIKASPGNLYSIFVQNFSATAGWLVMYNATSAPGDGALTGSLILGCYPLAASDFVSVNFAPSPPRVFSVGITAILTSATTCLTKTTGVITGFIDGNAP